LIFLRLLKTQYSQIIRETFICIFKSTTLKFEGVKMVETIINENTIERVSEIARLKLSDKEKIRFREEFERILEEFSVIDEIKVGDKELYYVVENVNVLREDSSPKPFNKINDIKNNFNKKEDEYIVVPRNL